MEYAEFLKGLDPVLMGLDSSTCSLDRALYWSMSEGARRVLFSRYQLSDFTDDYFDVQASFRLSIQWSEEDGRVVQPLLVECVLYGHFHAVGPINREHAIKFAETESWLIFWPYFRQFVSDTTARMGIPPMSVPLAVGPGERGYRLGPKAKRKKTKKLKAQTH